MKYLEETAVAKGIRRVTGVTGDDAVRAQEKGNVLLLEVKILVSQVDELIKGNNGNAILIESDVIALRFVFVSLINIYKSIIYQILLLIINFIHVPILF